jgi:tape measure domain-containing protein
MATIRTAIELQDNFTGILYQVINSVNLGLSAMEDLHQTMNSPVDTASIEAARDSINQATLAVQQLDAAMQGLETPASETPTAPTNSAPVVLPVQPDVPDPLVDQPAPVDLPVEPEHPEPVQVPVHWRSDNMEVFTSTGVERFEQEVQSANNMLNTLNQTQSRIAAQAAQTDLFPDNAIADMNNMQNRLQAIQQRIQLIESNPLNMGSDTANAELEQLRGQLDQAVQEQEALNRAVENMDVEAANQAYLRLSQTVGNTERYIRDNVDEQGRFNREIEEGTNEANSLMQTIKGAVAAYATIQTLSTALNLSDQLTSTTARLNLMNDGLQTTQDLQNMIYLSAERARGSYQATADAVSKLGLMAGDAFGSSEEIIAFMEQVNKQFTIAGTEAAGIDAAMLQLTQAMGSGVLRGEEYNSILEQAPNIIQAIADYMEVPKGQLKDMAAEGQITADIVKAAMFAAADDTNAKFEQMPKTFSQIWTSFQNTALMAFQPVLQRMNEIANSEAFQEFVNNAIEGLSLVAGIALEIFDLLVGVAGAVADNWSWLSPIIYGVAAALAVYYGWQLAVNAISAITKGIHIAMAIAQMIHAAATGALTAATAAEIAAQNGLNAALYACPIVWIIVLIIALIALFYAAVAAVNKFAGTSVSATGIICGAFMVAAAFIGNLFVTLINFVIDIFVVLWNFIAAFANFFANVFTDPVGAVARLFFDLVDTVLSLLQSLASAIDTIFGSNLAGAVQGWRDSLSGWVDDTFGKGTEVMAQLNADDMHLGRFEYGSAWDAGYSFGEGIDESIANFDPSSLFDTNVPGADDYANLGNYGSSIGGIGSGVDDIAGNTGKIADSMDITEEDLKYLRDIAEQEAINRFTTAEITIEQTNHNTVSGKMDLDGVVDGLTDAVNEAVDIIAEGVHE